MNEKSMLAAADALKALRDEKADLQAKLKDVQERIDSVEAELIQLMTDEECTGFDRNGSRFSLVIREFPGAVPEEKEELYRRMRAHGFDHLFTINTMNTKNTTAIATTDQNTGYLTETVNLAELFSEELDGLRPSFERIKIPAGGGLAYEVPGDDPNSPDSAKDFSAVILYHHPINSYYKEKFTGGNNPPDCSSLDGKIGVVAETGECRDCKTCPYAKFGSGENGGMACKQKRRMYLLREGEMLPIIMTLPTGSLAEFTKYVTRLVTRGMKANHVVTKFSLKRAQNSTGINYSQVICSVDRPLSPEEKKNIASMTEQVKLIAGKVSVAETETAAE